MAHQEHVPYYPQKRKNDDAEKYAHDLSKHDPQSHADSTFHGGGNAYEQSVHGSFDYKNDNQSSTNKYKHSQTMKDVPVYNGSIPEHHPNSNQVAPAAMNPTEMYDIEEQELIEQTVVRESHRKKSHSHQPDHYGGKTQHHTVVHIDDPNARSQLAHNHAMNVHAPTVLHAADNGIFSARCVIGTMGLVCVIGMIVVITMFTGVF
jgi:hypothetical protein